MQPFPGSLSVLRLTGGAHTIRNTQIISDWHCSGKSHREPKVILIYKKWGRASTRMSLQDIPLGTISAALTFSRNELHAVKPVVLWCEKGVSLLFRFQIHISFIFLTSLGRAKKVRWMLGIPWLPWLVSNPYIIGKREPTAYANKGRIPAEMVINKLHRVQWTNFISSSSVPSCLSSKTAHISVETPPPRLPLPYWPANIEHFG